jgi:hypothetical protein
MVRYALATQLPQSAEAAALEPHHTIHTVDRLLVCSYQNVGFIISG